MAVPIPPWIDLRVTPQQILAVIQYLILNVTLAIW